ncbi:MAG TPA: hypothetical protein VGR07_21350 [Thermoanaerobaculia bacterium]|nr:hypothetical protein [Thermoanaerobaculia bacterium]
MATTPNPSPNPNPQPKKSKTKPAIRLRGAIRAEMGPTTEQLTQFGIRPLRRRPLRHKSQTPSPAPSPSVEIQAAKAVRGTE